MTSLTPVDLFAAAAVIGFTLGFSQALVKNLRRWFRRSEPDPPKQFIRMAAKAVYEAAIEQSEYPNDAEWVAINTLRAAADQLTPYSVADFDGAAMARNRLLNIAAELKREAP